MIWIVEDEPSFRRFLELALEHAGFQVRGFLKAEQICFEALEAVPALLLTDCDLPGISGVELICHMKRFHPEIPVVAMSARSENKEPMLEAGAECFLSKPFQMEELRRVVSLSSRVSGRQRLSA